MVATSGLKSSRVVRPLRILSPRRTALRNGFPIVGQQRTFRAARDGVHSLHAETRRLATCLATAASPLVSQTPLTVYTHKDCMKHKVMFHPESPERLRYLVEDVIPPLAGELGFGLSEPDRWPEKDELLRIHTPDHVDSTLEAFRQVREGLTDSIYLDSDTQAVPGTEASVMRGAGATLQAVEDVIEGKSLRAFVMVRPPGHHAEPHTAMGFCVFNNIMLGVAHAQMKYPDQVRRVALLDFDVHHGNGGQAACWEDPNRFFASTHQSPLFPWKGQKTDLGAHMNVLNVPLSKEATSQDFRDAWENSILPKVREFEPDMIFVSAGFDAHEDDPLASMNLVESDFHFVTARIAEVANDVACGRLVTVLEGGYDPDALGRCVSAHITALHETPLPTEEQILRVAEMRTSEAEGGKKDRKRKTLFSESEVEAMDKTRLRSELGKLGLPTSGRLDALKERLASVPADA